MATMFRVLFALLAVGALALWLHATIPPLTLHVPTVAQLVNSEAKAATQPASVAASQYVDMTGTVLLDESGGTPVPYIQYVDNNHHVMTKQLIYSGMRGCAASAGDLPCVDTNQALAYPQYPTGTAIRVRGLHVENRILVYQVDVIAPAAST
jgi:hypothetical protein